MKKNLKMKKAVNAFKPSTRKEVRPFGTNANYNLDGACQEKIAEQLEPFCTMCLHFDWYIPYLFLKSAQMDLKETAMLQKFLPGQNAKK